MSESAIKNLAGAISQALAIPDHVPVIITGSTPWQIWRRVVDLFEGNQLAMGKIQIQLLDIETGTQLWERRGRIDQLRKNNKPIVVTTQCPLVIQGAGICRVITISEDSVGDCHMKVHDPRSYELCSLDEIYTQVMGLESTFHPKVVDMQNEYASLVPKHRNKTLNDSQKRRYKELSETLYTIRYDSSLQDTLYQRFLRLLDKSKPTYGGNSSEITNFEMEQLINQLLKNHE